MYHGDGAGKRTDPGTKRAAKIKPDGAGAQSGPDFFRDGSESGCLAQLVHVQQQIGFGPGKSAGTHEVIGAGALLQQDDGLAVTLGAGVQLVNLRLALEQHAHLALLLVDLLTEAARA